MSLKEENELLTRTGPGTPMGEFFRRFWLPALMPWELPAPDCPPVRIRLLSEDLVAFRDSTGRVGLLVEHCAHRGASLYFGRNEENGLRCVYHGWKYDVEGRCVDMPNEPAESRFKDRIRMTAYPAEEWGGIIWVYMGPPDRQPELPQLEWTCLPAEHRRVAKWLQDINYLQCLEGEIDTSHVSFLHSALGPTAAAAGGRRTVRAELMARDRAPRLMVRDTDYGFLYGARRSVGADTFYWRVTQWLMPTYSVIPSAEYPVGGRLWVPMDDEHTWAYTYSYNPDAPLPPPSEGDLGRAFPPELIPDTFHPKRNKDNDYLIDREEQRSTNFTGIYGINDQDRAVQESMGAIADRTTEHLGSADLAIIAARRRLLKAARELQDGIEPYPATHGHIYNVRSLDIVSSEDDLDALAAAHESRLCPR